MLLHIIGAAPIAARQEVLHMPLRIVATSKTDPGLIRERNEDSALVHIATNQLEDMALFIVADGMGGYLAGDRASALAVQTIQQELEPLFGPSSSTPTIRLRSRPEPAEAEATPADLPVEADRTTIVLPETTQSEHYGNFIKQAISRANEVIVTYGLQHREAKGLGSTITMAVIARGRAYFANVGDSRSYLFRAGVLRQITRDHSLVMRLVESGDLAPDEIYTHPKRNLIYRSLGSATEELIIDLFEEEARPGDLLLLCSDGLWEKIRTPEMVAILQSSTELDQICQQLVQRANDHGGEDNITVVLARCEDGAAETGPIAAAAGHTEDPADDQAVSDPEPTL